MKRIINIDSLKHFHVENRSLSNTFLVLSFFFSLAISAPIINIIFEFKPGISTFASHIISNAALNDLDISKRVGNYYKGLFAVWFFAFTFYLLLYKVIGKNIQAGEKNKEVVNALLIASLIGIVTVIASFIIIKVDLSVYFLAVLCLVLLLQLRLKDKLIDFELTIWAVLMSFPIAQIFFVYLTKKSFFNLLPKEFSFKGIVLPLDLKLGIFGVIFFITGLFLFWYVKKFFHRIEKENFTVVKNTFFIASIPFLLVIIVLSFLLETTNIINIRFGVVFEKPFFLFLSLFAGACLTSIFLYKNHIKSKKYANINYNIVKKYFYPILLLGFALISVQPYRMLNPENEFFEAANQGLSVDHFFRYGSIPIVETFDAHMLSGQIFGYIYGFLNGYEPWAPFIYSPCFYVIEVFIVYYLFKRISDSFTAFLMVLCLPILSVVLNEFITAGLLALFIINLLQKKTKRNFYIFWVISLFLCFYKLDIGFSALLSGLCTYFIIDYFVNKNTEIKKIIIPGLISVGIILAAFTLLCFAKGINPIMRFYEFILASMSNQNWAIAKMGDMNHIAFRLSYYILPFLTMVGFVYILSKLILNDDFIEKVEKSKKYSNALIFFFFFVFFFIFNVPRGIVRHNFEYGNVIRITSTIPLAMLMLSFLLGKSRKIATLLGTLLAMYLLINSNNAILKDKNFSLLTQAVSSASFHEQFLDSEKFNGTRVRESFDFSEIKMFKELLDNVLTAEETYFDFSSKNYYYALVGRKNPLYLNQSPLMINGDRAQEFALEQIKSNKTPIVIMPITTNIWSSIDAVYVDYKYYKITEYIYANYTPLLRMASFDVYAIKSKKEQYLNKFNSKGLTKDKNSVTDFNILLTDKVSKNNIQISKDEQGKITAASTGQNSFIIGLLQGLRNEKKLAEATSDVSPTMLKFNVSSTSAGSIKIYYNLNHGEQFSEERVQEFAISQAGNSELILNLPQVPYELMIAINTQSLIFNELTIAKTSKGNVNSPDVVDYHLGEVPRLWAEKSGEILFSKVPLLEKPLKVNSLITDKADIKQFKKPYYLFIEAKSNADMKAWVEFIDGSGKKAGFNFNIKPGKHKYVIRLSSNYYWWNLYNFNIKFGSDQPVEISKYSFIPLDGKDWLSNKTTNLSSGNTTVKNQ